MFHQLKNRNFYVILGADLLLFCASLILAYAIRFAMIIDAGAWVQILGLLPLLLITKALVFFLMGAYRGMWRYTSVSDAIRIAKASVGSTLILMTALTLLTRFSGYPRSVFLADCIFTIFLCGGFRVFIRMLNTRQGRFFDVFAGADDGRVTKARHTRLLIVGAGDAAASIIREINVNKKSPLLVVGCVDDNPTKHGRTLLDVPVRAPISHLPRFVEKFRADEILIAMPSVVGEQMRQVVSACKAAEIPFKTLPSLSSLVDGRVHVSDVRDVNYEDLLGRPPVRLDCSGIGHYLTGKTVAVTGAGGSIGSELCRQLIRFNPAAIVLIEANEFNLYRIEQELRIEHNFSAVNPAMGRVQDRRLMENIFSRFKPHVVFHAAACKHVPMVETNPWEGIFNNVVGSSVLMDVAEAFGVERFVLISTDKAVRPTNVMGACKRMAEILLQSRQQGKTRFMAVRFGNVLGSSGSVIPLFQQQIKFGGPVTVTHAEMTRYFMMIPEACQLVMQAGAMGVGGEIFILEMGTPVNIAEMARDMIRLSGKVPDQDIEIVYTGLRPGEKLYEELITHGEGIVPTPHEKIMVLERDDRATDPTLREQCARDGVDKLVTAALTFDAELIRATLKGIIPEYMPPR